MKTLIYNIEIPIIVYNEYLNVGDVITNERGEAHQMEALEES